MAAAELLPFEWLAAAEEEPLQRVEHPVKHALVACVQAVIFDLKILPVWYIKRELLQNCIKMHLHGSYCTCVLSYHLRVFVKQAADGFTLAHCVTLHRQLVNHKASAVNAAAFGTPPSACATLLRPSRHPMGTQCCNFGSPFFSVCSIASLLHH